VRGENYEQRKRMGGLSGSGHKKTENRLRNQIKKGKQKSVGKLPGCGETGDTQKKFSGERFCFKIREAAGSASERIKKRAGGRLVVRLREKRRKAPA